MNENSNLVVEFRKIPSLKFLYEVSSDGRIVRNVKSKHQLRMEQDRGGYYRVSPCVNGKQIHRFVHILVAECWLGTKPEGYEIDHIDHNNKNNCYTNLRYVTKAENLAHRMFSEEGKRHNGEITKARYEAMTDEQKRTCVEKMRAGQTAETEERRIKAAMAAIAYPVTLEKDGERIRFDSQKQCCQYIAQKDNCSDGAIYYYIRQRRKYIHGYHVIYERTQL